MTIAAVLMVLTVALAVLSPSALQNTHWAVRAPRAGVFVWMLTVAAMTAAALGAGVAAALPLLHHLGGLRELIHQCPVFWAALRAHLSYLLLAVAGMLASATITTLSVRAIVRQLRVARQVGIHHALAVMTTGQDASGFAVMPADQPAAWSLAVNGGYVVVTQAAVDQLDDEELEAVLAHERAHLRGHHHLLRTLMAAAAAALPCRLTRAAARQTADLLEMRADDVATRRHGEETVARALLTLSGVAPAGALGAGGPAIGRRLARLLDPPAPAGYRAAAAMATALAGAVLPVAVVTIGVVAVLDLHVCPFPD